MPAWRLQHGGARLAKAAGAAIGAAAAGALVWGTARGLKGWLPDDYSVHGRSIDLIFLFIFWLTFAVFVAVEVALVWFLVRYRGRPERAKARFIHGNTRLEMLWTLIPAAIFLAIAMWSKQVWDDYRYSLLADDPRRIPILVIGEQFKWNVVYPGPDGKLGRYLVYPKVTDLRWPIPPPGMSYPFPADVPGPAYMPEEKAKAVLDAYTSQVNPLGKDFDDPDGRDDVWQGALARPLEIPRGRPIEIRLSSKDVIHDFYLPNFRVKLDAVPGMMGRLYFEATESSAELEKASRRQYTLDEVEAGLRQKKSYVVMIGPETRGANEKVDRRHHIQYWRYADKNGETIIRDGMQVTPDVVPALRAVGISQITAFQPQYFELVCEQLCGAGHYTMEDRVIVLEPEEFRRKYETAANTSVASTAEAAAR